MSDLPRCVRKVKFKLERFNGTSTSLERGDTRLRNGLPVAVDQDHHLIAALGGEQLIQLITVP